MGKERASTVVTHASVLQTGPEPRCVTNCPQPLEKPPLSSGWPAVSCVVLLFTLPSLLNKENVSLQQVRGPCTQAHVCLIRQAHSF